MLEWSRVVDIDVTCNLESFRRFLINSTCRSYIPESYLRDFEVFPEKEGDQGSIYIEAVDKVTLKKIRDITFINARDVLGIIYTSKSGNSRLKWRQIRSRIGRVTGSASTNSLVNLSMARVITPEYVEDLVRKSSGESSGEKLITQQVIGEQSQAGHSGMGEEEEGEGAAAGPGFEIDESGQPGEDGEEEHPSAEEGGHPLEY